MATTPFKLATTLPVSPIVPAAAGPASQAGVVQLNLTAETGQVVTDTVTANGDDNQFVAGSGSLDVTGGPGAAAYVLHAGGGPLTVEDFAFAKGDTLTVDEALQGAFVQASDSHGGTLLAFGAKQGSIDLINRASISPSAIRFL